MSRSMPRLILSAPPKIVCIRDFCGDLNPSLVEEVSAEDDLSSTMRSAQSACKKLKIYLAGPSQKLRRFDE